MSFTCQFLDYNAWCTEMDTLQKEEDEKIIIEKINNENKKNKYIDKYGYFWIGPADVKIPLSIDSVRALNGKFYMSYKLSQDGEIDILTYRHVFSSKIDDDNKIYTENEYREKFAIFKDGNWYWKYIGNILYNVNTHN